MDSSKFYEGAPLDVLRDRLHYYGASLPILKMVHMASSAYHTARPTSQWYGPLCEAWPSFRMCSCSCCSPCLHAAGI
eukprot:3415979-Pyramimonas_sp.AAC.1